MEMIHPDDCAECIDVWRKNENRCSPGCLGWFFADSGIERCDDCSLFEDDDKAYDGASKWVEAAVQLLHKLSHMNHYEDEVEDLTKIAPLADEWVDIVNRARSLCSNEPEIWELK